MISVTIYQFLQFMIRIMGEKKIVNTVGLVRRVRSVDAINAFREDLLAYNWNEVYSFCDMNIAYEKFLSIFLSLYNKNLFITVEKLSMRGVHGFLGVYKTLVKRKMYCTKFILKKKERS